MLSSFSRVAWCVLLIAFAFFVTIDGSTICGGFVRAPEGTKVDFSGYKLALKRLEDNAVNVLDVDPFGSWYVPVEEDGTYSLSPTHPVGITFEPKNVQFVVKKGILQDNICGEGIDIIFKITGAFLSGSILPPNGCTAQPKEISEIKVTLTNKKSGETIATVSPSSDGKVVFPQVEFGEYSVTCSHSALSFVDTDTITVNGENVQTFSLRISSYSIVGSVTTEEKDGHKFVSVILKNQDNKTETARVSSDSTFIFSNISCGTFQVSVEYQNEGVKYSVLPQTRDFEIVDGSVKLLPFVVKGFTAKGKVNYLDFLENERKIAILFRRKGDKTDKRAVVTTSAFSEYTIDQMIEGEYEFSAELDDADTSVSFGRISVRLSPSTPHIPEIPITKAKIQGVIKYLESDSVQPRKSYGTEIKVFDAKGKIIQTVSAIPKEKPSVLNYSIIVPVTNEKLYISAFSDNSSSNEPGLEPSNHEITLKDFKKGVSFVQSTSTLTILLNTSECDSILVTLLRNNNLVVVKKQLACQNGKIEFDVPSSIYTIAVHKTNLCFVLLSEYDVRESMTIVLVPKGHHYALSSPYPVSIDVCPTENNDMCLQVVLDGQDNRKDICLTSPHSAVVTHPFYLFEKQTLFVSPTSDKHDILSYTFLPSFIRVVSSIKLENVSVPKSTKLKVKVTVGDNEPQIVFAEKDFKQTDRYTLAFTYPFDTKTKIAVEPLPSDFNLFYNPQIAYVEPGSHSLGEFVAHQGIHFTGTVSPPIEKASVKVTGGDLSTFISSFTNEEGRFSVGPLSSKYAKEYVIQIEKTSYVFEEQSDSIRPNELHFEAKKLSSIKVVSKTANGEPIPGVLVVISSDRGSRVSTNTDVFGVSHLPLPQSEYYVRVTLKEYEFTPNAKQILLHEAEEGLFETIGKRIRYHISGTVQTFGSIGVECRVKAMSESGESFVTTTSEEGRFIIRDLKPHTKYSLSIDSTENLLASFPNSLNVLMQENDIEDINIMGVFGYSTKPKPTISSLIKTEMIPKDINKTPEFSLCNRSTCFPFSHSEFFSYRTIEVEDGLYSLTGKIEKNTCTCKSLNSDSIKYKIVNNVVYDEQNNKTTIKANCVCKYVEGAVELNGSSAAVIFLLIVVFVAIYYRNTFISLFTPLFQRQLQKKRK